MGAEVFVGGVVHDVGEQSAIKHVPRHEIGAHFAGQADTSAGIASVATEELTEPSHCGVPFTVSYQEWDLLAMNLGKGRNDFAYQKDEGDETWAIYPLLKKKKLAGKGNPEESVRMAAYNNSSRRTPTPSGGFT
jgi:hypothetical protein